MIRTLWVPVCVVSSVDPSFFFKAQHNNNNNRVGVTVDHFQPLFSTIRRSCCRSLLSDSCTLFQFWSHTHRCTALDFPYIHSETETSWWFRGQASGQASSRCEVCEWLVDCFSSMSHAFSCTKHQSCFFIIFCCVAMLFGSNIGCKEVAQHVGAKQAYPRCTAKKRIAVVSHLFHRY